MTDLSSTLSSIGQRIKFSTQQAVTDINAWLQTTQWAGKVTFKVDVEDYAQDNTKATNIVNTWNSEGVTTFTGPLNSGTAGAILSLVDSDQMVMVSPSSTSYALAIPNDYLFRTAPTDNIQGAADACMMITNGVKGLIQVYRQDTYGSGLANFTSAAFKADGGTIVASIPYDTSTTNFGPVVSAIAAAWTTAMGTSGLNSGNVAIQAISFEELGPLLLAAQQTAPSILKTTQPWYGTDGEEGDSVLTNSTYVPEIAHIRLPSSIFGYTNSSKTAQLCSEMLAATSLACESYSLGAYDDVWLLALSLLDCGVNSGACVQQVFPAVANNYYGVTGWTTLNAAGDRAASDYQVWCVVPGVSGGSDNWNYCGSWNYLADSFSWLPNQAPAV